MPPERAELGRIARSGGNEKCEVSPTLAVWLQSMNGPPSLTPGEAQQWLGVWVSLHNAEQSHRRASGGADTSRPPASRKTLAGKAIHNQCRAQARVVLADGTIETDKQAVGEALVETRAEIWFGRDEHRVEVEKLLGAYARDKNPRLPESPNPGYRFLRGCILAAQGSAPGADGAPYEIYHLHPQLFAALLAQAFHLLPHIDREDPLGPSGGQLGIILGPSIDLLLWIPKVAGDDRVGQQRPLHLPTTIRRLFGSACKHLLSPAIEPLFTPAQAAVAGGSCQQNIKAAHSHLAKAEDPERPPLRVPHSKWACETVLLATTAAVLRLCVRKQEAAHPSIRRCPACFLLDQAKAFEMLSHRWLRAVLMHWRLPRWAVAAFTTAAEGRCLRDKLRTGWVSGTLMRGAGMGGPMSPLTWDLAFDPILWVTEVAGSCEALGYVDDLLAEIYGPGHAVLVYLLLLASTKAAGLQVEDHWCVWATCTRGYTLAAQMLAPFPTVVVNTEQDGFELREGPVELYLEILIEGGIIEAGDIAEIHRSACTCKTKHALVPAHSQELWARTLEMTPLAPAVNGQARFLGAFLTSRTRPLEAPMPCWSETAMRICKSLTWEKAIKTTERRCNDITRAGLALSIRADEWNTYCVSTVPYPASIVLPDKTEEQRLLLGVTKLFPTGKWAWKELALHLGPALGLPLAPRDPRVVAATTAVLYVAADKFAGPPTARIEALDRLHELEDWARADEADLGGPLRPGLLGDLQIHTRNKVRRVVRRMLEGGRTADRKVVARMTYLGLWNARYDKGTREYLLRRSRQRRWAPSDGEEWVILGKCEDWAKAWLITRLLLGGLPGTSSNRPLHLHGDTRCWGCGQVRKPQWRWLSPAEVEGSGDDPGVAWCARCCNGKAKGGLPGDSAPDGEEGWQCLPGPGVPERGSYSPCPLCGKGEAGSEHLAIFCKVVERAWQVLDPQGTQWWPAWVNPNSGDKAQWLRALRFSRGVAFTVCALGDIVLPNEHAGVRLLVQQANFDRQIPAMVTRQRVLEEEDAAQVDDRRTMWQGPERLFGTREARCPECARQEGRRVNTWHGPHQSRKTGCSPKSPDPMLLAAADVMEEEVVFTLRASQVPALWPQGDLGTLGQPLTDTDQTDNIRWQCLRCFECRAWKLTAVANRAIKKGEPLRGPAPKNTTQLPDKELAEYRISFDGGARHRSPNNQLDPNGPRAVGAGAIVWGPADQRGRRDMLAQISLAEPRESSSLIAEALGLRAGMSLAQRIIGRPTSLEIVGDNLPVLRMCAGNAKVRTPQVWELLEGPIMDADLRGWQCEWIAVRRCFNAAADGVATHGTLCSVDLVAEKRETPVAWVWVRDPRCLNISQMRWMGEVKMHRSVEPFWSPPQ